MLLAPARKGDISTLPRQNFHRLDVPVPSAILRNGVCMRTTIETVSCPCGKVLQVHMEAGNAPGSAPGAGGYFARCPACGQSLLSREHPGRFPDRVVSVEIVDSK